jgi:glutamate-1-semialdehyde 2,1-aminomutase
VKLQRPAQRLFPGGVNSPVRAYLAVGGEPPVLVRGAGSHVWDDEGREYVDCVGAYGPLVLGHADAAVARAIREAAFDGGPFGVTSPAEERLGQLIQDAMPSLERLRFVNSGTEAAMSALRLARAATGRDFVLKFEGGYHGHSDGLLARAGSGLATLALPASAGVTAAVAAQTLVVPYNDLDAVRRAFAEHGPSIAAIVVEPVAANMGVVLPGGGFLEGLREIATAAGALLVFDEVITGYRLGRGGAQERFGVRPDLTVLGKIIGGGLPVGAYGGRADLMALVAPAGPMYQAGTLSGHPLVMAAGIATLEQLTPAAYERLEATGARLEDGLRGALPGRAVVRAGSLLTVFFRETAPRDFAEASASDTEAFARFFHAMRAAGVLLPPSQFEAWFLSTAHDDADVDLIVEAARRA